MKIYPIALSVLCLSLSAFSLKASNSSAFILASAEVAPTTPEPAPTPPSTVDVAPAPLMPEKCPVDIDANAIITDAASGTVIDNWKPEMDVAATGDTFKKGNHMPPLKTACTTPKPLKDAKGDYCKYTITDKNGVSGVYRLYWHVG